LSLFGGLGEDDHRFGFNGMENDKETSNGNFDFGNRIYNSKLGKFLSVDRYASKFPSQSPYTFANNKPIAARDINGDSIIIMIWTTGGGAGGGGYGHAAIAVQNYKKVIKDVTIAGINVGTLVDYVPDGTWTYYDLWPGEDADGDGFVDGIGSAGPRDKYSGPMALYQNKSVLLDGTPITLDVLINGDPSEGEGYSPNGVIRIDTDILTDVKVRQALMAHMNDPRNSQYTSCANNCSDLVTSGVAVAVNSNRETVESYVTDWMYWDSATTPNYLYKYVKLMINAPTPMFGQKTSGKVLKDPGSTVDNRFRELIVDPAVKEQISK
jgi:RHS repeat-associated protein